MSVPDGNTLAFDRLGIFYTIPISGAKLPPITTGIAYGNFHPVFLQNGEKKILLYVDRAVLTTSGTSIWCKVTTPSHKDKKK